LCLAAWPTLLGLFNAWKVATKSAMEIKVKIVGAGRGSVRRLVLATGMKPY
jgi:hypothetical protein